MYEGFFGFQNRPFLAAPQTSRYFPAATIESARKTLVRAIERGEGAGLIVGPSGTGKTLLCQILAEHFKTRFSVAMLAGGRLATRQALLQAVLYELGLPYRGLDEGELRLSLLDRLEPGNSGGEGLLLLVDEAHTLSWRLLEEVRMLTNLVRDGSPRVRVALAGSAVLEERFASPKLSSFSQRLAARCYLESLDRSETAAYVRSQIAAAGGDPARIFNDEALSSVYRASDGVPRLINQVCDHALILCSVGGLSTVTSDAIEEAWADLQQLPAPWNGSRAEQGAESQIVEFGGLDEVREDAPEAIPFRPAAGQPLHLAAPDDQLDAIEAQLSTLETDFPPGAAMANATELDFPEFGDPFSEQFDHEEVVLDHYPSDATVFADRPRVSSWEGQELGTLLEPLAVAPVRTHEPEPVAVKLATPPVEVAPAATAPSQITISTVEPAASIAHVAEQMKTAEIQRAFVAQSAEMPRDRELFVIDDDIPAPDDAPPPARARKLEYRQLFARLRRG